MRKAECQCSTTAEVMWNGNNNPVSVVEPTDLTPGTIVPDGLFATEKNNNNSAARKATRAAAAISQLIIIGAQSNDIHGSSTDSPRAADDGRCCPQQPVQDALGGGQKPKPSCGESADEEDDDDAVSECSVTSLMQEADFLGELRRSREEWRDDNAGGCVAFGAAQSQRPAWEG